jgi:hypothetical protein
MDEPSCRSCVCGGHVGYGYAGSSADPVGYVQMRNRVLVTLLSSEERGGLTLDELAAGLTGADASLSDDLR